LTYDTTNTEVLSYACSNDVSRAFQFPCVETGFAVWTHCRDDEI